MTTRRDVIDYYPYPDDYTADLITQATATLASLRGLDNPDPAMRLHLLTSLRHQLDEDLLHTVLAAHDHGYTPDQIATLTDRAT
jgi:hypothetical protein